MAPADSTPTLVERVTDFVSENKRAILVGTAAVLAVGGVLYVSSASSSRARAQDLEKGEKGQADKKKSSKKKTVKDADGPILEERKPKKSKVEDVDVKSDLSPVEDVPLTPEQIALMTTEERSAAAAQLKQRGNSVYQARKFAEAAELYTRAIQVSPKSEPVFFSNRAACYINMTPPLLERVVEDCDAALALDRKYVKALNRRATALENLERYEQALRDFTAATILEKFANEATAHAVERVLKKMSTKAAEELLKSREPRLPSHNFVSAYFAAFRPRPLPQIPEENPQTGDNTLLLAVQALEAADYVHAMSFVGEAIEQGITTEACQAEALNLRGTFRFLMGDVNGAKEDLLKSIELVPTYTQSLVKIASVYMEQGDAKKAFDCFEDAIKHNPNDPDIYYHRGQVLFIMNQFDEAAENYTQSTKLDDQFVFSHIQLAVAQYKSGNIGSSMAKFRSALKAFPEKSEPQNYYGELLLDQGRFEDAIEKFDKAIEIEKTKPFPNVLAMVNKGLALYQWKQDINASAECCKEALAIDNECEAAVATLAQLALQQSKIEEAIGYFERQVQLARSEPEMANALTYQFASKAQAEFLKTYPEMAAELNNMARAM